MTRRRVLFLCSGNSARSQMAEAFANHLGSGVAEFHSAGTWPSREVNIFAITVMLEKGVDMTDSTPKSFTAIPRPISLVVTVCGQAAEECPSSSEYEVQRWDLPDPATAQGSDGEVLNVFRQSRDEIERRVRELLGSLRDK